MKQTQVRVIPVLMLMLLLLTILFQYTSNNWRVRLVKDLTEPGPDSRVLVIAPHSDDETLATGALIHRLTKSGAKVLVVVMTNGDGFSTAVHANYLEVFAYSQDYIRLGRERQQETTNALKLLGVSPENIIFLGYPDGGLYMLWSAEHWDDPYASKFTRAKQSPYVNSYTKRAAYSGVSVSNDLQRIVTNFQPTYVVYPHPNDSNSDHLATYNFTKYALTNLKSDAKQYLYLVHRGIWPLMLNFGASAFLAPPRSLANSSTWYRLELKSDEFLLKKQAIEKYRTQIKVMEPKLMAFLRRNELLTTFLDSTISTRPQVDAHYSYSHYLLQSDPTLDLFTPTLNGAGDLKAFYGYREAESGDIHFFLETRRPANNSLTYSADMFIYHQSGSPTRLRVSWKNGETAVVQQGGASTVSTLTPIVTVNGSIIEFSLPGADFADSDRLLLGCSTSDLGRRVDNMGWRVYNLLQQKPTVAAIQR